MRAILLAVLSVGFATAVVHGQNDTLVEMFDGKSLSGWRGDQRVWSVQDGAIVGSTHGVKLAANTFLIYETEYADFEFSCQVRLAGNNTGVQYRSRVTNQERFSVAGSQCDVHPNPPYVAMLYGEGDGGIIAQRGQFVRRDDEGRRELGRIATVRPVELTEWRTLRIVARGDLVWHELDGVVCTAVQDQRSNAQKSGVIALQCHRGVPMKACFRNLTVRALASERDVPVPKAVFALLERERLQNSDPVGTTPSWLWDESAQGDEEVFFRREFDVAEAVPKKARLAVTCDNHCRVYVNGDRVLSDDSWESPGVVDIASSLKLGKNVVAVHGWNEGGPAGMALRVSWRQGDRPMEVVTDASWRCSDDDPDGWDAPGFDDSSWPLAKVYAALGDRSAVWSGTHGAGALGNQVDAFAPQVAIVDWQVRTEDLQQEAPIRLLEVPRELGSWVSLTADPQGRLYSSSQGGGLFRITPAKELGQTSSIERVPVELGGAHGLLWFRDSLYAVVNGRQDGLYRLTDSDGDDMLDRVELLRALDGSGEHGPHSIKVAPDGEHLLVLCGNMTKLTELASSRVQINWQEDRLLPRIEDARGFWGGYSPPGGCLYQIDPDAKEWELLCCGFRNPFDFAVLPTGQIIVYDADMEWDMGLPWYRPTRYLEALSGVDYGWRKGSAKWPVDYPDAPPALVDIGPGSPTGMVFVPGAGGGVIGLDWTFGTAYLDGKPWLTGVPFPIADVTTIAGPEGGTYIVTGGRGLPSKLVRAVGPHGPDAPLGPSPEQTAEKWRMPSLWERNKSLSAAQILDAAETGALRWKTGDRQDWVAARIALERLPVDKFRSVALDVDPARPDRSFAGLLALARQGTKADLQPMLDALNEFAFEPLTHRQRIAWLRVHALALLRQGPASDAQKQLIADRLMPLFPADDERQDQDLCELLAYVDAPGLLAKAVPLLSPLRPSPPPQWAELATRNQTYGGVIDKMMANMPPMGQIAIANALRTVKAGWTIEQRRALFHFLAAARTRSGGASYDGFIIKMIDFAWQTCSEEEQRELEFLVGRARAKKKKFNSKPPKGPGRNWQVSDIDALVADGFEGRNRKSGRNLFHAIGCASCHYFRGEGGFGGPDLTSVRNKFRPRDLLESILDPNKVISDQYSGKILTKKDGTALFGVVHKTYDGDTEVYEVVPAVANAEPIRIPVADVAKVEPSPQSPMPAGLLNGLNPDEVRDLVAFLIAAPKQK